MFVLGLLVLAAAVIGGVELGLANRQPVVLRMWNWTWHIDAFWLAVIGVGVIVMALIGLGTARLGLRHTLRMRRERRDLAAENARLADRARAMDAAKARETASIMEAARPAAAKPSARPAVAANRPAVAQQARRYPAATAASGASAGADSASGR
jgi:uncharacterized membrane protein YciS (DUF1049 family)